MVLGHLLFFSFTIAACLLVVCGFDNGMSWSLVWLPICLACFATYIFEPETFRRSIPCYCAKMCQSRATAFVYGCMLGVLQLFIMAATGVPLYLIYRGYLSHYKETALTFVLVFTLFWIGSMIATNKVVVLIGRNYEKNISRLNKPIP